MSFDRVLGRETSRPLRKPRRGFSSVFCFRRFSAGIARSGDTSEPLVILARWSRSAQTLQPEVTSSLFCWWDQRHWWQPFGSSGAAATPPDALKPCSSSNNCPIKFRLGLMIGRAFFTSLYASTMDRPLCRIMYAIAIVALRDTPAWQCTNTLLPAFRASSARQKQSYG